LKRRIAGSGLIANMGARRSRHNIPLDESIKEVRQQIQNADALAHCGALKGDVMIQFSTGKVEFAAVFGTLKAAGFDGPLMVECCKVGATAEETMVNARANRQFLEHVLAKV
jgi:sugar phosphate isomerase/epimerase